MRSSKAALLASVLCLVFSQAACAGVEWPIFDVPKLDGITVDGGAEDWGDAGFRVDVMASSQARLHAPQDLSARMRIGWDDEGLLVLVAVRDNAGRESPDRGSLWWNDSVEFFHAERHGSPNRWQGLVAPGADPQFGEMRTWAIDQRPEETRSGSVEFAFASRVTDDGYVVEARLPWANLGIEPEVGVETALNVFVNDCDLDRGPDADKKRVIWYPSVDSWRDSTALHRVRLALKPGPPPTAVAVGSLEAVLRRIIVQVAAAPELAGRQVAVRHDGAVLATADLKPMNGGATAALRVDIAPSEPIPSEVAVTVGGQVLPVPLPDAAQAMLRARAALQVVARPPCFAGAQFPALDFEHPLQAERLIGPYAIETQYCNAQFQLVQSATEPGRYGAVVTVRPEEGRPTVRYRTLFHQLEDVLWFLEDVDASVELPAGLGIGADVAARRRDELSQYVTRALALACQDDPHSASLLAGLYEDKEATAGATPAGDARAADRQWWVTMKRKLNGMEEAHPGPFVCPRPVEGASAPALREGAPAEAGMKPGSVEAIDLVLTEWQADTDEPFAVCIARHGVIVLHKAYPVGEEAFAVDTPTWMASITKTLSGTLMMMLVDQGLVDLDATVDAYLPAFRGIEVSRPMTVRHLYTHTAGLWDHWGDEMHDLEHVIAMLYPGLGVGVRYEYDGAGYALGGKIIEMVSGEAVPQFYQRHLLGPLGCTGTSVVGTSGDAASTALDMARIAQMLLNRGAYGDARFFSEETFERMLPVPLDDLTEQPGGTDRGPGIEWTVEQMPDVSGPSPRAFGHGSAAGATLIIDPEHDLLIIMARNAAGASHGEYHPRFITAVYGALADGE